MLTAIQRQMILHCKPPIFLGANQKQFLIQQHFPWRSDKPQDWYTNTSSGCERQPHRVQPGRSLPQSWSSTAQKRSESPPLAVSLPRGDILLDVERKSLALFMEDDISGINACSVEIK